MVRKWTPRFAPFSNDPVATVIRTTLVSVADTLVRRISISRADNAVLGPIRSYLTVVSTGPAFPGLPGGLPPPPGPRGRPWHTQAIGGDDIVVIAG